MEIVKNFIDGKAISFSNDLMPVINPATGDQIKSVINSGQKDFEEAVTSAIDSQKSWSKTTPLKRSRVLSNYKNILENNLDNLAELISKEHGKTIEDAKGSLIRGIEVVEFASGIPHLLKGEFSQNVGTDIDSWSMRQPLGVCAGITPFNFPAMVPMWMYPISIACGNSFILKPSEKNPSCAIELAKLFTEAGLPNGVLNVLNGNKDTVNNILTSEQISSVSFVGSTPVAKYIYEQSAKYGKRVQSLGGAKNHLIVMPDANIDQATNGIIGAAFGSAGERCMAVSVAVAVGDIADKLIENVKNKAESLKVAPYTDSSSDMGPVISKDHLSKIHGYIQSGVEEGANLIMDGRKIKIQGYENGYFLGPTLFDNVNDKMKIYQEEIFGPVLCVVRAKNYDEALNLVNNHKFGNGTSIYTSNGSISHHFTSNVKIGMVGVNVPIPVPMAYHSFGGWKNSLFGESAMHGTEGIKFYTKLKTITSKWPTEEVISPEYSMPIL